MVINNAGVHDRASMFDTDAVDKTERVLSVNLLGALAVTQATAPVLVANGNAVIVNVLSAGSWLHGAGMLPYTVSKAAALSLTHATRAELNPHGVQVTAVHAGFIDTDMMSAFSGPKLAPLDVARTCVAAVRRGEQEVLVDDMSRKAKAAAGAPTAPLESRSSNCRILIPVSESVDCSSCGLPMSDHDRHIRFTLPDSVLALPDQERTAGTWMTHSTPGESVMMQSPGVGAFVRVLLPIQLTGGYSLTYGLWLGVSPTDLKRTFEVWWQPEYVDLELTGTIGNAIKPWGLFGAPVVTSVRDVSQTPYCTASTEQILHKVLTEQWPHQTVLGAQGSSR